MFPLRYTDPDVSCTILGSGTPPVRVGPARWTVRADAGTVRVVSAFDPDTGLRVLPDAAPGDVARPARNPFDRALTVIWASSAGCGILLVLTALASVGTLTNTFVIGPPVVLGVVLLGFAVLTGVAHLASHAARWRPPDG